VRDCLALLKGLSGLELLLPRPLLFSVADGDIPLASLNPLLCPYPLDAADDIVLVRLNSNGSDELE